MRVKNRSVSTVGYAIPELNIRRRFVPGEIKEIPKAELDQLLYQPGGHYLLANYLQIHKDDLQTIEMVEPEREYFLSEEQVKELLKNGSLDAFKDALDFAPQGIIDLIKHYAVELPLNDVAKLHALKQTTGFDAAKALSNKTAVAETPAADGVATGTENQKKRRVEEKYQIIE